MTLTIGQIRGWAFGTLHLSRKDFYEMRQSEFWEAMEAHRQEVDADRRHVGELIRGATLRLMNLQLTHPVGLEAWPMPWDEQSGSLEEEAMKIKHMAPEERDKNAKDFINRIGWDGK